VSHTTIAVSPRHHVRVAEEYTAILKKPQKRDFVVRTLTRREANGLPLMAAEIVIAGADTRAAYPLAETYPLHFRKTYFAARLHGDSKTEFERHTDATAIIDVPPPIGHDESSFRSCLVPGTSYGMLSPFKAEPEERNLRPARELSMMAAAGHYRLIEQAYGLLARLHERGLAHGDAVLQNFIVCPSPLEIVPIDYEAAVRREELEAERWEAVREEDFAPLLREALLLQCALGAQPGALAEHARRRAKHLFKAPQRFLDAIDNQADLDS
jgi:hypothetical protein